MCDTLIATPAASRDGIMIFAKNSDREPNEAQNVTLVPAMDHPAGSRVRCTYIEVPQAAHTHAVILSRPFWMFGAEMGVNEHGVAIGNEAVFTKEKYAKTGLTGMDMLRLALERGATAAEARDVVLDLLERYGQGGNCGYQARLMYHNSFIIADSAEAYVLETAGAHWAYKKVEGVASISNCLTLGDDYDASSPGVVEAAKRKGTRSLDFAAGYGDFLFTRFAKGRVRQACTLNHMMKDEGNIATRDMFAYLRDHREKPFRPGHRHMERICLHAGGLISTQTTGSMVALVRRGCAPLVYCTGTAAPCLSAFRPHLLTPEYAARGGGDFPAGAPMEGARDIYGTAEGRYDPAALWWRGEDVHRRALMNYGALAPLVARERDALEDEMLRDVERRWLDGEAGIDDACSAHRRAMNEALERWGAEVKRAHTGAAVDAPWSFRRFWKKYNAKAGFKP